MNELKAFLNYCGEAGPQGPAGPEGPEGPQGPAGPDNLFIAEIGTTTFDEVTEAVEAGKFVGAYSSSNKAYWYQGTSGGKHNFMAYGNGASAQKFIYTLDESDTWQLTSNYYYLQTSSSASSLDASKQYAIKKVDANKVQLVEVEGGGGGAALYKHHIYVHQSAWEDPEEGTSQEGCDVYVDIISSSSQPVTTKSALNSLAASGAVCSTYGQFTDAWDSEWKIFNYDGLVDDTYMGFVSSQPYGGEGWVYRSFNEYYEDLTITDTVTQL